jgi:hypothetical protein
MKTFETNLAAVLELDQLSREIVAAIAAGRELPEEFLVLDTYADAGYPPSWDRCDRICREVQRALAAAGIPVPTTHTMLDEPRGPAPVSLSGNTLDVMVEWIAAVHTAVGVPGRSPYAVVPAAGDDWSRFELCRRALREYTAVAATAGRSGSPTLRSAWVYLVALAHELAGQGLDNVELDELELVPVDRLEDEIEYLADYSG